MRVLAVQSCPPTMGSCCERQLISAVMSLGGVASTAISLRRRHRHQILPAKMRSGSEKR